MANPKKKTPQNLEYLRSLARSYTTISIQTLAGIAEKGLNETARVAACAHLLDRGWGKPDQPHTGADGGDIRVTIRTIIEGKKKA